MTKRLNRLNALQNEITTELNTEEIGKDRDVLFLYESIKEKGIYYGRTQHFRLVRTESDVNIAGKTLPVIITGGNKTALLGNLK